jgi:hypothetical protein
MPLVQLLNYYEGLAGKKVTLARLPDPPPIISVHTDRPLTKNEALQCLEKALKEQASLVIIHGADGSLTAVPKLKESQY